MYLKIFEDLGGTFEKKELYRKGIGKEYYRGTLRMDGRFCCATVCYYHNGAAVIKDMFPEGETEEVLNIPDDEQDCMVIQDIYCQKYKAACERVEDSSSVSFIGPRVDRKMPIRMGVKILSRAALLAGIYYFIKFVMMMVRMQSFDVSLFLASGTAIVLMLLSEVGYYYSHTIV